MKKIIYMLLAINLFIGCANDDKINTSESTITSENGGSSGTVINPQNPLDQYIEKNFTKPYGIEILYRFLEREVYRSYTMTPTRYEKSIEFINVFNYLFVEPYIKITSKQFLKERSFNTVVLIGEPAFSSTGAKLVGFASAGVKIHLLAINQMQPNNIYWLNDNILAALYHENAHTWQQARLYPTDYEKLSASDYKKDNWTTAWNRSTKNYLPAGFVTEYSSFNSDEDFVEILARYIVYHNATQDCGCATTDQSRWGRAYRNKDLDSSVTDAQHLAANVTTDDTDANVAIYRAIPDGFDREQYTAWKAKFSNYGRIYDDDSDKYYESANVWEEELKIADEKIRPTETYTGKQKIEQKIAIIKKYLLDEWNINLDELRAEIRSRYPYVAGRDFEGNPVPRKDFSVLPNN